MNIRFYTFIRSSKAQKRSHEACHAKGNLQNVYFSRVMCWQKIKEFLGYSRPNIFIFNSPPLTFLQEMIKTQKPHQKWAGHTQITNLKFKIHKSVRRLIESQEHPNIMRWSTKLEKVKFCLIISVRFIFVVFSTRANF